MATATRQSKPKNRVTRQQQEKTRLEYIMSDQCRRPRHVKDAFIKWIRSNKKFRQAGGRKPTVDEVVSAALKKGSPLYGIMETDEHKAAEEYWRSEAQYLLRHVEVHEVRIKTGEEITRPVRGFMPIRIQQSGRIDEHDYLTARRVRDDVEASHTVVQRALSDLQAWKARYERYAEFLQAFAPVIHEIEEVEKQIVNENGKLNRKRA